MVKKIALLTDFHYGFPEDKDMENYFEPVFKEMIDEINRFEPNIVVGMGDYIQHKSRGKDTERLQKISELISRIDTDFYAIAGNHDVENLTAEQVINELNAENKKSYFSININNLKLIFLDTTHRNRNLDSIGGILGEKQREWLEDEVETEKDIYIFSHHLLHNRNLSENWYFDDKPELAISQDKRNFNEIIKGKNVRGVFSAHIHDTGLEMHQDIPHVTMKAMDKYNPPEKFQKYMAKLKLGKQSFEFHSRFQELSFGR
jgi:3',5'-cyclic AMP phosphodiesterase CpdA